MKPPPFSDPEIHLFCMKSLNLTTLLPQYFSPTHLLSQKSFYLERDISNYKLFFLQDAYQNLQLSYVKTSTIIFQGLFHSKIIFLNLPHYPALTFLSLSLCFPCIFHSSCPSGIICGLLLAASTLYPCLNLHDSLNISPFLFHPQNPSPTFWQLLGSRKPGCKMYLRCKNVLSFPETIFTFTVLSILPVIDFFRPFGLSVKFYCNLREVNCV